MSTSDEFIGKLIGCTMGLQAAYDEVLFEWSPDVPPITTLFAAVGAQIAKDFHSGDYESNRYIFLLIEQAMESDNSQLVTAVATGLIEAMISKAIQTKGEWQEIVSQLGPRSHQHAQAWLSV